MDCRPESKTRKVDRERGPKMYRGVRMREWGTWVSEVRIPKTGERIWLGSFDNPEEAARAHDAAIYCIQGDNAVFNFPDHMRPSNLRPPPGPMFKTYIKEVAKVFAILNDVESPVNIQEGGNRQDLPGLFEWFDEVDPPTDIQEPGNTQDLPHTPVIGETGTSQAARARDAAMYCLQGENTEFDSSNHMRAVGLQPPEGSSLDNSVDEIARLFASFGEVDLPHEY